MTEILSNIRDFESRVRESFARQRVMRLIGAEMKTISAGVCEIELPFSDDLTQQDGYIHAGIVTAVLDSACGYAALSMMPEASSVLSVEFKVNLLSPAKCERLKALAEVKKAGRTLTVCNADAFALTGSESRLCATMLATMIRIPSEPR